jgi:hypothetical protein
VVPAPGEASEPSHGARERLAEAFLRVESAATAAGLVVREEGDRIPVDRSATLIGPREPRGSVR